MTMQSVSWESKLIAQALKGLAAHSNPRPTSVNPANLDEQVLQQAFDTCTAITRYHSRTFYLASSLLPARKRQAVRVLYAFCRTTDDLVDKPIENVPERLDAWARITATEHPDRENLVAFAWHEVRHRYQIPPLYAEQLVKGVAMDMIHSRYETFHDLVSYCYGVASTVGLMSMHIIGFKGVDAVQYAVKLGVALQLTNILRDVGEDWQNGRLYLPLAELHSFDLGEADIARGAVDDRWRKFMRFQIARTRQIYAESLPGIRLLHQDGRFSIAAAAHLYQAILEDIERNDYDVFHQRAFVSTWGKVKRLPWIWLESL